jgi:tripartite-type tricarboxylate transporter receptor subunit TctC
MRPLSLVQALLLAVCVSMLSGGPPPAVAAGPSFPEKGKPITFIVPYAAGGANDLGARMLAPLLEKELRSPVQVVNRPGAGGQVGTTAIAMARPDGYKEQPARIRQERGCAAPPEAAQTRSACRGRSA